MDNDKIDYKKEYYKKNKDKMNNSMKEWRKQNPNYHKEYYLKNKKEPIKKDNTDFKQLIYIGKSNHGLNGKKKRQLLNEKKNFEKIQKYKSTFFTIDL